MHPLNENGEPMHPKDPRQHGWAYLSVNLHITMKNLYKGKMDRLKEITGKPKNILWLEAIDDKLNKEEKKLEREKNEQGDHNINTA
tara:strand:- start:3804 stop:4061 length:258 start_codon:yes stop_codon:yes gene_type:complete